jgi:hypothetical protein
MVTKTKPPAAEDPAAALRAVPFVDDPIEFFSRCVLALAPELSAAVLEHARAHTQDQLGGGEYYVGRDLQRRREQRNAAIKRDHQAGERIPLLQRRYGLTRSQLHRILAGGAG